MTRSGAIFGRWLAILGYAFLGPWFGCFVALVLYRTWQRISPLWPRDFTGLQYPFIAGTSLILLILLVRFSGAKVRHAERFWSYPPLLTSVGLVATAAAAAFAPYRSFVPFGERSYWVVCGLLLFGWIIAGVIIPLAYRVRRKPRRAQAQHQAMNLQELSFHELQTWLDDERAIETAAQDLFGAEDRARRIWNALQTRRSRSAPHFMQTVVLEGALGSGKTSVINVLDRIIRESGHCDYLLVPVSAWGFSSAAARQHILGQVVEKLSMQLDCLAVHDLPRRYIEAVTESQKWLTFLRPSLSELAPAERLRRLLPMLSAVDLHLVVIIEDSDRNDAEFNPQHLQSMLNDFREVERLSFILTVGSSSRVDFPKVAEQIESIPRLSRGDVLALVDRVRDYCLSNWPSIDPLADEPE
jgi:hypothetical protein